MKTFLFAGGGTLGPVTPLLSAAARLRELQPDGRFIWAGTDNGPERELIEAAGISFLTVPVAKLPRYASWQLLTAPLSFLRARTVASRIIAQYHPDVVISAGGFTAVPVVSAAAGRIPCVAHQLDYQAGLSNRLVARKAAIVTTSFEYLQSPFGLNVKTRRVPTPVRFRPQGQPSRDAACRYFGFDPSRPVLFVFGGGTGARALNEAVDALRRRLPADLQILHLTGKGKGMAIKSESPSYVVADFLADDMKVAYAAADLVVSRAGMGAISELAALRKASILVPLPDSPQIANVRALGDAIKVVQQTGGAWWHGLEDAIIELLNDSAERERLGQALHHKLPTDDGTALATVVNSYLH